MQNPFASNSLHVHVVTAVGCLVLFVAACLGHFCMYICKKINKIVSLSYAAGKNTNALRSESDPRVTVKEQLSVIVTCNGSS